MMRSPGNGATTRAHGGPLEAELRELNLDPAELLDFSVNTNPYGPCRAVMEAVRRAPLERYPDPTSQSVREALGRSLSVRPEEVVLGNGAADLLWTVARVLIGPGSCALIVEPTFGEFRAAVLAMGGRVVEWRAEPVNAFAIDLIAVARVLHQCEAGVVYLCAPNTPTGVSVRASDVASLAREEPQVTVLVDQSFLSLSESFDDQAVRFPDNVICIRSLTKDHAIPGVRVGYLVASDQVAGRVEACRPAWTTSAIAQAAAFAAIGQGDFIADSRKRVLSDRNRLAEKLRGLGLNVFPSTTPFFIVPVPRASELRRRLLHRHHILIRECTSFGLPNFVRLCGRPQPDCERLLSALQEECTEA